MAKQVGIYEVLKVFRDKETRKRYIVGAFYPGEDPERIAELQEAGYLAVESEEQEDHEALKHVGDGTNGEKVKGKEAVRKALDEPPAGEVTPDANDTDKS
ncbi:hypothetical protein H1230_09225 [Paenibacillus sp. 19GGS1-52]|uniref:hypothetical protein n=1 Tax=Paenibacillus sp. 19GGS1-52 TaxID=2758563 RepID=UPI001EFA6E09|nr:hypothetical protein [Paenibacillus sp. 19GGS1-52]ULO08929.1 hypothetical protein H1230_09225 [Paenibacillus sp. 19GGS1-52]